MAKTNPRTTAPGPPPKEAIDYLRHKGVRTGYDYREVWREEHARAFTIANMMHVDMLADVQASIATAQEEGWPADRWKREMADELAKRGWWGRLPPPDPNDPEAVRKAKLYLSRRLDTIWRVNTRQAALAGVWERGMRSRSHPYILYRVGPSKQHREQHLAWDGVLLPKDDPFWAVAAPMNGWGCKCFLRFVSEAQYRRYRRNGLPHPAQGDGPPPKGRKQVQTESPELRVERYRNDKTGEMHTGYVGIDHGFERNPGIGRMEQLGEQFQRTDRRLALAWDVSPGKPTQQHPDVKPVADGLDVQLTDRTVKQAAEAAIAAIDEFHNDGNLPRIPVQDAPPDAPSGRFVSEWDDAEKKWIASRIEVKAPGPWPELTTAHEIGHFLDHSGLQQDGSYSTEAPNEPLRLLLDRIKTTETFKAIIQARDEARRQGAVKQEQLIEELYDPAELFARAYSQYIAWRSGDPTMLGQIDAILRHRYEIDRLRQWPYADFLPLIQSFDTLFEEQGWLIRTKL